MEKLDSLVEFKHQLHNQGYSKPEKLAFEENYSCKFHAHEFSVLHSWKKENSFCAPRKIVRYSIRETHVTLQPVHYTPKDRVRMAQK